jgi:hypothetical protein
MSGDVKTAVKLPIMPDGYREEKMRDAEMIALTLHNAHASGSKTGKSAIVNVWADPRACALGSKAHAMHK